MNPGNIAIYAMRCGTAISVVNIMILIVLFLYAFRMASIALLLPKADGESGVWFI